MAGRDECDGHLIPRTLSCYLLIEGKHHEHLIWSCWHSYSLFHQAVHPNNKLGTLIHDLKQFTSVFATPIHQSVPHIYVSALAFAPTSSVIYELCRQFPQSVRLRQGRMADWPRLVSVFTGHSGGVNAVAISPDGSLVVSGSDDETIRFWNAATGAAIGEPLTGHSDRIRAVAFSPDGTRVVSGSYDETVRVWS